MLVSAGYTVVFIAHEQVDSKTNFISPKGDKRCMNPIIDKCDYVVYLKSNGIDSEGKVIKSSGYLAETKEFFARARIEYTPIYLPEFTAETLTAAIQEGIDKQRKLNNATVTSFAEQQKMNMVENLDFDELKAEFNQLIQSIPGYNDVNFLTPEGKYFKEYYIPQITLITERNLGKGKKVSECTSYQVEALSLIVEELREFLKEKLNEKKEQ